MRSKYLPFYIGAIVLMIFTAAVGWQSNNPRKAAKMSQTLAPMPNLDGEKAKEFLAESGLDKSLGAAMERARYSVNWVERAPLANQSGAFEAKNAPHGFAAYFSGEGVDLVSRQMNEDWNLALKLKSFERGGEQLWTFKGVKRWTADKTIVSAAYGIESEISESKFEVKELFE